MLSDGLTNPRRHVFLTPAIVAELEWLAGEAPPTLARHARIVLSSAQGLSIPAVAARVGVHPNSVRNCLRRFETDGVRGLGHGGAGKPKNIAFTEAVRDEIARVAMHSPAGAGEPYPHWSLRLLRAHLIRRGVAQTISVEGLRQLLRGLPLPQTYWRRPVSRMGPLSTEVRHALESLANGPRADRRLRAQIVLASNQGLSEAEIASALRIGRGTVRRWLRRFRRAGILGLHTLPRRPAFAPELRRAIVRVAATNPRHYGANRAHWSLATLQATLIGQRVVPAISIEHLRRILTDARVSLRRPPIVTYPAQSPAVG